MVNEFALYEQLLNFESIAENYTEGKNYIEEIRKIREQLTTRLYRVAVIGEFKRGKSSLLNALIGADVLPTDILPMTAAVTRVTYGTERKIEIFYKDGSTEEKTVEELVEYATKYDEEKEKKASTVKEIVVTYPSVFCQNHIDFLDTPGLNDNESMTDVTFRVLGEVDAAIVVISANHPMSMTEKTLILDLIAEKQIRHLIFVVTHIDVVRRKTEQERLLDFFRERLTGDVWQMAEERFDGDEYFLEKAMKILQKPNIYGVSSTQAMEGFIQDNWNLLEMSRFPRFKNELLTLLTAAQSMDMQEKVKDILLYVNDKLEGWYQTDSMVLEQHQEKLKQGIQNLNTYYEQALQLINQRFMFVDEQIARKGLKTDQICKQARDFLRKSFISSLATIRADNYTEEVIRLCLNTALKDSEDYFKYFFETFVQPVSELLYECTEQYGEARLKLGFSGKAFAKDLQHWNETGAPVPGWSTLPVPETGNLKNRDLILTINQCIDTSVADFENALNQYIYGWRVILIKRIEEDQKNREPMDWYMKRLLFLW